MDDFLSTASTKEAMNNFYEAISKKYEIKRLCRPRRFLGSHFHYGEDGSIALSQRLLIDKI